MTYIEEVLDLIQEQELSFALGRVLEEVTEGALSDDDEDRAAHLKCAAYFLKRQLACEGEESETVEEETPAPARRKAVQERPKRQCEGCGAFKGVTAFETNGRTCRKCRNAAVD